MATEQDAFCTVEDVRSHVQREFGPATVPTLDQVLQFMAWCANEIEADMAISGLSYTVDSGARPIPSGEPADTIRSIAANANARGAAAQAIAAQYAALKSEKPEKAKDLAADFLRLKKTLREFIGTKANQEDLATLGYDTTPQDTPRNSEW